MKISIVGTGNVATQLAMGFEAAGISIGEISGRTKSKLKAVVNRLYVAEAKYDLDFRDTDADVLFLCVSDAAIEEVASRLRLPEQVLLVHTSGALPMSILEKYHSNIGVFYPLQSISLAKQTDWAQVPLVINANYDKNTATLLALAKKLSMHIYRYSDEQKKAMHLAAVFGSNFTNHLLKIVKDISEAEGLDFQIFKSLVQNTVTKAFDIGPENGQTGPAIRGDEQTIKSHLAMLEGSQDLDRIYKILSGHIRDTYNS
jgi:predicted short-subunit dehydrogenase-like oxidoreductase (DUF2520 family)